MIDIPGLRTAEQDLRAAIERHILGLLRSLQTATDEAERADLMHELLAAEGLRARMDRIGAFTDLLEEISTDDTAAPLSATRH